MIRLWLDYDYDIQQIQPCNDKHRLVVVPRRVLRAAPWIWSNASPNWPWSREANFFGSLAALWDGFSIIFFNLIQHWSNILGILYYLTVFTQHRWSNFGAELANIAISSPQVGVQSSKRDVQKSMWYNPSPKNSIIYDKQLRVWNHALFG